MMHLNKIQTRKEQSHKLETLNRMKMSLCNTGVVLS